MANKTRKLKRPIVMYNITQDCDMRCVHCYNESGMNKRYTPSNEELLRNTEKISKYAGAINFTGGEPFKVAMLPELLALSAANGVDNIITSNGQRFLEKDAPKLLEGIQDNLYMMKIGMMGANAKTNDYIRGSGHFKTAVKALDLMANYNFVGCMKVSLDKHNMNEIEDFCKLALEHKVDQIVFGQLVEIGRASRYLSDLVFLDNDLKKVEEDLIIAKEKYWGKIKIAKHCTLSGLCQEKGNFYTITARGAVSPCLMREDLAIGNIAKDDLAGLFEKVDKLRNSVKNHSSIKDLSLLEIR